MEKVLRSEREIVLPNKYTSVKGHQVSRCLSHDDMWIIEDGSGKFHNLIASKGTIASLYPPKQV